MSPGRCPPAPCAHPRVLEAGRGGDVRKDLLQAGVWSAKTGQMGKNPLEEISSGAERDLNLCRKLFEQHPLCGAEGKFHCHSVKTKQTGKKITAKYTSLGFEGGGAAMNLLVEFSEPYFSPWMHPKPPQLAGHPR